MSPKKNPATLIIAGSETDANLYYRSQFLAPDPFIYIESPTGRRTLLMNDLELGRAKKQSAVEKVVSLSDAMRKARKQNKKATVLDAVGLLIRQMKTKRIRVPSNFPVAHADGLRERGFRLEVGSEPFFPVRSIKTPKEVKAISETQRAVEESFESGLDLLRASKSRNGKLVLQGKPLTSERMRQHLHREMFDRECLAEHTIIACGDQGVDPHEIGHGPLYADRSIVFDIFPRSMKTRYFADMSRTVVKGRAKKPLRALYDAVLEGQQYAFDRIKHGCDAMAIHRGIQARYEELGYRTGPKNGQMEGFFHGTGHGVGLDIHEPPRISGAPDTLLAGQVVTVEPGLYYRGKGAVRLEDMVLVTKTGCKNLTRFEKVLEIR